MKYLRLLILFCFFAPVHNIYAQEFEKYTVENGLTLNEIQKICQDEQGNIYIATFNGLNVFNGSQFKHYDSAKSSVIVNCISAILPIKKNFVLIGTQGKGLFLLNKERDEIITFKMETEIGASVLSIQSLHIDSDGIVWIGTNNNGLFSFHEDLINTENLTEPIYCNRYSEFLNLSISAICSTPNNIWLSTFKNGIYCIDKTNKSNHSAFKSDFKLPSERIWDIKAYNDTLFAGTENGLCIIDSKTGITKNILQRPKDQEYHTNIIRAITQDKKGNIWVGCQEDGLYRLTFKNKDITIKHYKTEPTNSASLNTNKILALYAGKFDNIWIGTWNGGLNKYSYRAQNFKKVRNFNKANILSENMVKCFARKGKNSVWIGTYGSGICTYNTNEDSFHEEINIKNNNSVSSLYTDKERQLLIAGSWGYGLYIYKTPSLDQPYTKLLNHPKLKNDRVYSIIKDTNEIYWIGTITNGLFRLNLNTGEHSLKHIDLSFLRNKPKGVNAEIRQILTGSKPNTLIILSHEEGIYEICTDKDGNITKTTNLADGNNLKEEYNFNFYKCIFLDHSNNLYIGTDNGVLFRELGSDSFTSFLINGKAIIQDIIEDEDNNMWFGAYSGGLIKYSPLTNSIKKHYPSTTFIKLYYSKEQKKIISATHSGINELNPSTIVNDPFYPEITFDNLQINNQQVYLGDLIGKKQVFTKHINHTQQLRLPFSHNTLSVDVNTLSFFSPNKNRITYHLEGYETDWHEQIAANTRISYRNIPTGEYKLQVKVANKDDVWNPRIREISLAILPPWWKTQWAYLFYTLFILALIYFIIYKIKQKATTIQKSRIDTITKEKDELHSMQKMRFFTNISHDIRTPLTLILGPLESIIEKEEKGTWLNKQHRVMQKNADMLLRLINQILDFRKVENHALTLHPIKVDLLKLVRNILSQFESVAALKNIIINFDENNEITYAWIDKDLIEKAILNIISNALKQIGNDGVIAVKLKIIENRAELRVKDDGPGIAAEDLPNIFERFYQSNYAKGGTGIGLTLTQKIVELHKGSIKVESELHKGAEFIIELPIGEEFFTDNDISSDQIETIPQAVNIPGFETISEQISDEHNHNDKLKLLVIDDNEDIREYLKDNLTELFNVIMAKNGNEGIKKAQKHLPALIISDIMMDDIDGTEVCSILKKDTKTAHIPIILLTSKTSEESTIEGFEKGADDYICKPFNIKLLKTRIKNLIGQRNQLREKYSILELTGVETHKGIDKDFLSKVIQFIEDNINSKDLAVADIANALGMSHDKYYRKIKTLTGLSANKLTRKIRLKKAASYLQTKEYSISEVLYMVGFSSPSYFTKSFTEEFGMSPQKYVKELQ